MLRSLLLVFRGAALLAAVTAVCYRAGLNTATTAMVFLVVVVLQSLDCGFLESAVVSAMATASLDYFFTEPRFSFEVGTSVDLVSLASFLIVSLAITRIQAKAHAEAAESRRRRWDTTRLYSASLQMMGLPPSITGTARLKPILNEFELDAVCVFDATTLESCTAGASRHDIEAKTRDGYIAGRDWDDAELNIAVRCLWVGGAIAGAIGLEGIDDVKFVAHPLAALAAMDLERGRVFRRAASAVTHADAEALRSAILDALAHEIKTPLAAILTAAGGIRATGTMEPRQAELAELIESEASRLGHLTSRLLRTARLDTEEIKPRLERVTAAELAERAARRYAKMWRDRRFTFRADAGAGEVRADPVLIHLAISQLLENACRYSQPDAHILVDVSSDGGAAAIQVLNDGSPIPPAERERIFERFYRGSDAKRTAPGSGLGLYVARKIALAHGGNLALAEAGPNAVAYRLSIPKAATEDPIDAG